MTGSETIGHTLMTPTDQAADAASKTPPKTPAKTPEEWRDDLLDAALMHVPFDGWTATALRRAAADVGLTPEMAELAFPGGAHDVLEFYLERADRRLAAALAEQDLPAMRIRERITTAVRTRLELAAQHREAARRTVALLALPHNARLASRTLYRTVDTMWRAAGDTSTDYNFYSKRAILAGVYSSTLLVWLGDQSEGFADSWAFLDRRIAGVMRFEKAKAEWRKATEHMPSLTRFLGRLRYPAG